jgi:hypothetical protein
LSTDSARDLDGRSPYTAVGSVYEQGLPGREPGLQDDGVEGGEKSLWYCGGSLIVERIGYGDG